MRPAPIVATLVAALTFLGPTPTDAAGPEVCVGREGAPAVPGQDRARPAPGVSRLLLALSVLQLADRKVLDLDDPVAAWVEGVPKDPFPRPMRVRHLVEGTSGLRGRAQGDRPLAQALARHGPLRTEPGARAVPSALADRLLARIIEEATGRAAGRYVRENLLDPLQLADTTLDAEPWAMARASTADLLRLAQALLREGELDGVEILSPEATSTLLRPLRAAGPWADGLAGLAWKMRGTGPRLVLRGRDGPSRLRWILEPARPRACVARR